MAAEQGGPEKTINVAFAGHIRARDLLDSTRCAARCEAALALLREAGVTRARLMVGRAEGADRIAIAAWKAADMGPIHLVHPFLDEASAPEADAETRLDGAMAQADHQNPYLQQTRWLVSYADLVIVLWNGEAARGAGGTADAALLALERGLPVMWIAPAAAAPAVQLISHGGRGAGFDLHDLQAKIAGLNSEASVAKVADAASLRRLLALDLEPLPAPPSLRLRAVDRWLHGWLWKSFDVFKRVLGGRAEPSAPNPTPADLAADPGFRRLTEGHRAAADRARRLAAVHRSEQVLLLIAAVIAAVVGTAPAVWPGFKIYAVSIELSLALAAFAVWLGASRARRHQAWSDARRLAERLRAERAGWTIGATLADETKSSADAIEEQARDLLRAGGAPSGSFDAERVRSWGGWVMAELISGQKAYHEGQARLSHRIAAKLQFIENSSFVLLLLALGGFIIAYVTAHANGYELDHAVGGVVVMIGAIVPAIGAACMALEAKLGFEEQHARSRHLALGFAALEEEVETGQGLHKAQDLARRAIRMIEVEAETWREGAERRRLFRGG